jgi:hypothetical protein
MEEQDGSALDSERLLIYPNPNQGRFVIQSQWPGEFELMDAVGKVVDRFTLGEQHGYSHEIRDLNIGVYFVRELRENAGVQRVIVTQ